MPDIISSRRFKSLLDRQPYFTSAALEELLRNYLSIRKDRSGTVLTAREQNVVQLIAEGHTNKSTGAVLNLSVKTVETHRASAMRKLNVSSAAELVRYAVRAKLISALMSCLPSQLRCSAFSNSQMRRNVQP